jgi:hypothetical protein
MDFSIELDVVNFKALMLKVQGITIQHTCYANSSCQIHHIYLLFGSPSTYCTIRCEDIHRTLDFTHGESNSVEKTRGFI